MSRPTLRNIPRFAREETPRHADRPTPEQEAEKLLTEPERRAAAKRFRRVELTNWLVESRGLDVEHARAVSIRLLSSAPRIRGAFLKWWLTGRVEDIEVEGYGLQRLVEEKGMSVFGALLTLSLMEAGAPVSGPDLDRREEGDIDLAGTLEMVEG